MKLSILSGIVFLLNIPFGYWRARVRRFSVQWFVAVHLPVAIVITLRIVGGFGWQAASFLLVAAAFVAGQFLGGRFPQAR